MLQIRFNDSKQDILKKYRAESLKINLTQRYMDKKKIVKDVKLLWDHTIRTLTYN
ncbi:MAG: hypothetical protein ACOCPM_03350 [Bacteroidales bacterium]